MILDTLDNASLYTGINAGFGKAFEFLRRSDLASLHDGKYEIDGERVYALVGHSEAKGRSKAPLEAHRKYIDIQFVISGDEQIGWQNIAKGRQVSRPYDDHKDVEFFADAPANWLAVAPGTFTVLFPNDLHAPLGGSGHIHRVVVKVAV